MKRILSLCTLLLSLLTLQAQPSLVSGELNVSVLPTNNGNGTFDLSGSFSDSKGRYFASDVTAGMCLWKGNDYYLITAASASGSNLDLTVEDTYGTGFMLTGIYSLGEQTPNLGLPAMSSSGDSNPGLVSPPDYAAKFNYILQQIDQGVGSGVVDVGDYLYVSQKNGDNATAVQGQINRAWADPWAAKAAANDDDVIVTLDGRWVLDTIGGSQGNIFFPKDDLEASSLTARKDLTFIFNKQTAIETVHDYYIPIFYDTTGADIQVLGDLNIYYKEYASNGLGRIGAFGGSNIQPDGTNGTKFNVHLDTLWIGDTTNTYWRHAMTAGNCEEFSLTGNYHRIHRAWSYRGFSSDTISRTHRIAFKEGYWTRTDVTINPGRIMDGGSFIVEFEKLKAEIEFYALDNVWNEGDFIFRCKDLTLLKSPTHPNQELFFRGSYTNATRLALNARWIFDVDNCVSDTIAFHTGISHRYDPGTNCKMIFRGNYLMRGVPVFTNNGDANVNGEQMEYIIQNATIRAEGSPAVIMNDSSAVTISNSIITVPTGEPAIQMESNGFRNLIVANSTLNVADTTAAIQSVSGDYVATIRGTYASNGILDPDVSLIVDDSYGQNDTITVTIPCLAPSETVTTGTVGFWNCPDHLIGAQVVESQVAFYNAGTGGTVDVQLTNGLLGYFGTTIADGDRVETTDNGGTPLVLTTEQYLAVLVASIGATTPPDGLVVTLKIITP